MSLSFKAWLDREQDHEDIDLLERSLKIQQFVRCLPVNLHRWFIEKAPKTLQQTAKFADEFAILYKPLKLEKFTGSRVQRNHGESINAAQTGQNSKQWILEINRNVKSFGPTLGSQHCGLTNHDKSRRQKSNSNPSTQGRGMFNFE